MLSLLTYDVTGSFSASFLTFKELKNICRLVHWTKIVIVLIFWLDLVFEALNLIKTKISWIYQQNIRGQFTNQTILFKAKRQNLVPMFFVVMM